MFVKKRRAQMLHQTAKVSILSTLLLLCSSMSLTVAGAAAQATDLVQVNKKNYPTVETSRQFVIL